ncbi:hypothetical protein [Cellulosimicrobium cellulans]|uniref:hypothetical protein n=1 Tax=Cellulosimicrobium cellulans TaxID=1710 RepID=UPI001112EB02|nr:hypothetical protein [Cellulosimicrobium cellulans]
MRHKQDEKNHEPIALARPMPSEHRTRDRDGRPVTLRGVVTHVAGHRVAFEYHHPERGLWHLWVPDSTCVPVKEAGVTDAAGRSVTVDPRTPGRLAYELEAALSR